MKEHDAVLLEEIVVKLCKIDNSCRTEVGDDVGEALEDLSFYSTLVHTHSNDNNDVVGLRYKKRSPSICEPHHRDNFRLNSNPNNLENWNNANKYRRKQSVADVVNDSCHRNENVRKVLTIVHRNFLNYYRDIL